MEYTDNKQIKGKGILSKTTSFWPLPPLEQGEAFKGSVALAVALIDGLRDSSHTSYIRIYQMSLSNYLTGNEAVASVAAEEITLDQVLKDHQERYEQRNDQVKAWVCVDHTGTKDKCLKGPLRGMVIGIKDIISTSYAGAYHSFPS
jgi:hypothetical protein